jgi:peptide/nickel transport system ATP-binding protein
MAGKATGIDYLSARNHELFLVRIARLQRTREKWKSKGVPESEYLTQMHDPTNALSSMSSHDFFTDSGTVRSVDGVTFGVPAAKPLGVVGESAVVKSVNSLSLMQLLQRPKANCVRPPPLYVSI